jgi:hypothetical protein
MLMKTGENFRQSLPAKKVKDFIHHIQLLVQNKSKQGIAQLSHKAKNRFHNDRLSLKKKTTSLVGKFSSGYNQMTATEIVGYFESKMGKAFNEGIPSVYDKAMDATYHATHIGGGKLHRLLDESHTLWGAWDKCKDALPNDSFHNEFFGYLSALGHDLSSTVGLPVADFTKEGYESLASWLEQFGVNRSWTTDMLHVNAMELIGMAIQSLSVILNWNSKDIRQFSDIVMASGLSSMVAANPLGVVISIVGMARSYTLAKNSGDNSALINGVFHGAMKSTLFMTTSAVIGGPAWIGFISAFVIYMISHDKIESIEVSELSKNLNYRPRIKALV